MPRTYNEQIVESVTLVLAESVRLLVHRRQPPDDEEIRAVIRAALNVMLVKLKNPPKHGETDDA